MEQDEQRIIKIVKDNRTLEPQSTMSSTSHLCIPSKLPDIPSEPRGRTHSTGSSLLQAVHSSQPQKLLRHYRDIALLMFRRLGVKILNADFFAITLSQVCMIELSVLWHEDLASILLDNLPSSSLSNLKLISLSYPRVKRLSAEGLTRIMYLPCNTILCPMPTGLDMCVIDSSACSNPSQSQLFVRFGAATLDLKWIRIQGLKLHQSSNRTHLAQTHTVADIVSRAKCIFRNRNRRQPEEVSTTLCFPDNFSSDRYLQPFRGNKLFNQRNDPLTKFCPLRSLKGRMSVKHAHPEYIMEDAHYKLNKVDWLNWLHLQAGLAYFPRSFRIKGDEATRASYAMEWIAKTSVKCLAESLANHWDSFGVVVSQNKKAREAVQARLVKTILPLPEFAHFDFGYYGNSFLDIVVPVKKITSFKKLEVFGVVTKPSTQLYLHFLEYLSKEEEVPVENVHAIYWKLQQCLESEEQNVR